MVQLASSRQDLNLSNPTQEKEMATHSNTLTWGSPVDRGALAGYSSQGCKRVKHNLAIRQQQQTLP